MGVCTLVVRRWLSGVSSLLLVEAENSCFHWWSAYSRWTDLWTCRIPVSASHHSLNWGDSTRAQSVPLPAEPSPNPSFLWIIVHWLYWLSLKWDTYWRTTNVFLLNFFSFTLTFWIFLKVYLWKHMRTLQFSWLVGIVNNEDNSIDSNKNSNCEIMSSPCSTFHLKHFNEFFFSLFFWFVFWQNLTM